ncbi:hypothetical protein [uncultured Sulfitobacter sp.]|uniref:hypothetical protein n=1 Tax=uncultured Sulfitobacter sp. TaxID=191468 RepID=UPI0026254CA9|nr:hypothetical protein [uncultured Sulfitobacter sp.]
MTNITAYTRPTNTSATKVGDLKRTRRTRKLDGTASLYLTPVEMLAARESVAIATRSNRLHQFQRGPPCVSTATNWRSSSRFKQGT